MKRTLKHEEESEKSLLHQEMLDLTKQVSEAKRTNILLKDQLQTKLLSDIVRKLDSPTDHDLSPQSQEILGIFKLQTARSILFMQEALLDLSSKAPTSTIVPEVEEQLSPEDSYGDDESSDEEIGDNVAAALPRSNSLVEIIPDLEPQEAVPISGDHSFCSSRDCCTVSDCVML